MIKLLYIDLFCGAGGTSTGVAAARLHGEPCAKVIACVNHDANAIASHKANHPDTLHFTEDIRTLDLTPLVRHTEAQRKAYPNAHLVLWASLECTNFSKAKGGQPRDADSRTLAEHLYRYIEALHPHFIQVENVEEFMAWGDLDKNGKPVSRDEGRCYMRWLNHVCSYGYRYERRILNAADYGAYTTRRRFFGQFAANGLPIAWPLQTHAKPDTAFASAFCGDLFPDQYKPWRPVREVLDLADEGESIFTRKKPLCEATLRRIYAGLVKFVAGQPLHEVDAFILKYNSMNQSGHHTPPSIDEPCPTVAVQNRLGLAKVNFLSKQFSGDDASKNISVDGPAGTVTCIDHHAFLTAYYGNGFNTSTDSPSPTIPTKDRMALVTAHFLANEYSGGGQLGDINHPNPAVLTKPKQKLVSVCRYLFNPSYQSKGCSVDRPCFTLVARMDKVPPYLVTTETGEAAIAIFDTDSPMTVKIKTFMAAYHILDIKMRMLHVDELKRIMGFPADYVLIGTQGEQKKFIGNAVECGQSRVLCEALARELQRKTT